MHTTKNGYLSDLKIVKITKKYWTNIELCDEQPQDCAQLFIAMYSNDFSKNICRFYFRKKKNK